MVWFAPLIAAAAGQLMKKPEPIEPIQAGGGVVQRRKDGGGGVIMGALGDIGMNAIGGSMGSAGGSSLEGASSSGANPSGPQSMENPSILSRRKENLLNLETLDRGMSAAQNNPDFKDYMAVIDDAKKKARGY